MLKFRTLHGKTSALLAALTIAVSGAASAQTIDNVASASWTSGGENHSTTSNQVSLDVTPTGVTIETFHPTAAAGRNITVQTPICGSAPISLPGISTGYSISTSIERADTFRIGENLFFQITAAAANLDSSAEDSLTATLTAPSGDREEMQVFETGANTGVFIGAIPTLRTPPAVVQGDCRLSVADGQTVTIEASVSGQPGVIATATVMLLADPFGVVFDSETGEPVSGAQVTLVDAVTGLPATVFAEDGVTPWPSTVISGQPITDAAGNTYPIGAGEYWFPLTTFGQYRIEITPPAPYSAPSVVTPEEVANLRRPDGRTFDISDASYGGTFDLISLIPVQIDIPVDRPAIGVSITKSVSRPNALPGDAVFYTISIRNPDTAAAKRDVTVVDTPSQWLRLRKNSIRIDGVAADENVFSITPDGSQLSVVFDTVAAGATHKITYAMVVRADAPAGQAVNVAAVTDSRDITATTRANILIERETIGSRMTIIGRITDGPCTVEADRRGIPGVRVMLEDGSYAITDFDGRYHFEGIVPGTHVAQALTQTLPEGSSFVDCHRSTRSAGSASSRFIIGQGGSLVVADFHAVVPAGALPEITEYTDVAPNAAVGDETAARPTLDGNDALFAQSANQSTTKTASGADIDFVSLGDGPTEFLFPELGHNPRAPAVRVAIRHRKGERVELFVNGEPVGALAFDGAKKASDGDYAVSLWRGVPLPSENTVLTAKVLDKQGAVVADLSRNVAFTSSPARAEIVKGQSRLIADGATNPVIAVRMTDRKGRPIRNGVSGGVTLNSPYESAQALEAMQLRQLSGLGNSSPTWTIDGDDGIALIELAPTMVSGPLRLDFTFTDGEVTRTQQIEDWVIPGAQEWTVVGLAEGTIGSRSVADNMERSGSFDSDLGDDARIALYAKGRVLGKFLLTVSYDSAKEKDDTELLGFINPNAYYTVFADGSRRQFDAASKEKLYVRIESDTFYALYGDFVTGFDQTELARYVRTATGVKAEGRVGRVHAQGFAAEVTSRYRRDEIQGAGITGPYDLSSRAISPNSERVVIETRDRFRSEVIVSTRELARFIDYDIDILSGTISFSSPVLSRDFDLNPQFIVIDYETETLGSTNEWNAGVRADYTTSDGVLRIGATAITDKGDEARTDMAAIDLRARISANTEIRGEIGASRTNGETDTAWLLELEHHTGDVDVLAYMRSLQAGYGLAQQNAAERGRRKIGFDARYAPSDKFSVVGSIWRDDSLTDDARRQAIQVSGSYRVADTDLRLGIARYSDRTADGATGTSTVLEGGVTQRLLGNRLELSATSSIAIEGTDSIDLPTRHRIAARYALTNAVRLIGSYEISSGDAIDARNFNAGVELTPWSGARVLTSLGQQDIKELGKRTYAAYGLAQSFNVGSNLTLDATIDGNKTIGGGDFTGVVNPEQPVAGGGQISQSGALFEDFTAATLGATWRKDRWSATGRAEYRDGEFADRTGFTFGAIRQLGEGSVIGSGFTWTRAEGSNGQTTEIFDGAISAAHRPAESEFAFLTKLEYRSDKVTNAVAGESGAVGQTALIVNGDAKSRRLIGSVSTNWSPNGMDNEDDIANSEGMYRRSEFGVFVGGRYNFDSYDGFDLKGFTALGGVDARIGIGERIEVGATATVRSNLTDNVTSYSIGPQVGFTPADGVLLTVGYNITGFRDDDFSAARNTDKGIYAAVRMKFDADTFSFLGLGR
ncbi:DUF11 domain-containing protein [Altererythrobacter sp. ZODW24]|uniref:DUF11 domain-containing protein n=1 Tax=Altererythrobacter sp. ZODW24 TaxID=2185142 RepID=UPI000DF836FC|nr:DUF11 domain-containing protein [Altererythrobacter sp. ZODW24]